LGVILGFKPLYMLHINNYKKFYDSNLVLNIPSLELQHNIYWLKGENGSGKTTLIKSIAGLVPFDGTIAVGDADIRQQRMQYRSFVNYAEAEPLFPGFLTGEDLVSFYAEVKNAPDSQVQSLIKAFGVGHYVGSKTSTYSSGMGKKLSLVLGFIGNPKLILLDEPLITLDEASLATLKRLIEEYYNKGVTFVITSHQEIEFAGFDPMRLSVKNKTLGAA
jgi:ABC-2 type transport system ATP-binding protein